MKKYERKLKLYANNTPETITLKNSLLERKLNVKHIITGSSKPILAEGECYTFGTENIRMVYRV
jgi:hypothetical protein